MLKGAVLLFVAVSAIAGVLILRSQSRHQATAQAAPFEPPDELPARPVARWVAPPPLDRMPAPPAIEPKAEERAPVESPPMNGEQQRARLANAWAAQSSDAFWAAPAQKKIDTTISEMLAGTTSHIDALECRATLCRAEVTHQNEGTYARFQTQVLDTGFWQGEAFLSRTKESPDGSTSMTLYFAREGTSMATL